MRMSPRQRSLAHVERLPSCGCMLDSEQTPAVLSCPFWWEQWFSLFLFVAEISVSGHLVASNCTDLIRFSWKLFCGISCLLLEIWNQCQKQRTCRDATEFRDNSKFYNLKKSMSKCTTTNQYLRCESVQKFHVWVAQHCNINNSKCTLVVPTNIHNWLLQWHQFTLVLEASLEGNWSCRHFHICVLKGAYISIGWERQSELAICFICCPEKKSLLTTWSVCLRTHVQRITTLIFWWNDHHQSRADAITGQLLLRKRRSIPSHVKRFHVPVSHNRKLRMQASCVFSRSDSDTSNVALLHVGNGVPGPIFQERGFVSSCTLWDEWNTFQQHAVAMRKLVQHLCPFPPCLGTVRVIDVSKQINVTIKGTGKKTRTYFLPAYSIQGICVSGGKRAWALLTENCARDESNGSLFGYLMEKACLVRQPSPEGHLHMIILSLKLTSYYSIRHS